MDRRSELHKGSEDVDGNISMFRNGKLYSSGIQKRRPVGVKRKSKCERPDLISHIHRLLWHHRMQKSNGIRQTPCSYRTHLALQKAIRLCYELQISESKLFPVGDLIQELVNCSGHSKSLFGLLLQNDALYQLKSSEILYPNRPGSDNNRAFEYYLNHAITMRDEEFEWNNGRALDIVNEEIEPKYGVTPLVAAVQLRDPQIVLTLLRYGADPFLKLEDDEEESGLDPLEILIDDLNGLYLFKKTDFSDATKVKLGIEEEKGLQCLAYMRRSVLEIPVSFSRHVVTSIEETDRMEESDSQLNQGKSKKVYNIHPGMVEELFNIEVFLPTVSLQHVCRCAIRRQLRLNRLQCSSSLPKMISALPLPSLLKAYVDLQSD